MGKLCYYLKTWVPEKVKKKTPSEVEMCPEMYTVTKNPQKRQICLADCAMKNLTSICKNCQFHQTDSALRNLTKIHQNDQIHENSLALTKFGKICHFCYCMHFWT